MHAACIMYSVIRAQVEERDKAVKAVNRGHFVGAFVGAS